MPRHRGKDLVGIARIDGELRNLLAVAQAKVRPGLARVGRFVNAVADRQVRPMQPLTAADIDNIRVRRRYGNRADGAGGLVVKDRLPRATVVVGLPHSAIAHANVKHIRLAGHASDAAGASATVRANGAPVEGGEEGGGDLHEEGGLGLSLPSKWRPRSLAWLRFLLALVLRGSSDDKPEIKTNIKTATTRLVERGNLCTDAPPGTDRGAYSKVELWKKWRTAKDGLKSKEILI